MSYDIERESIETWFTSVWGKTTKVLFENTNVTPPKTVPWVRFSIISGDAFQASIGPTHVDRYTGMVQLQIFCPLGKGTGEIKRLADVAVASFRQKQLDTLQFRTPYVVNVGETGEQLFQLNVIAPFYRNDIISG